jgi:secreted trypsin-like serine protease
VQGRALTLYGWGSTRGINGPYDMIFRSAVLTDKAGTSGPCGRWGSLYGSYRNLCAGGPGLASCNGDSGGPLVNYKATGPVVVGIVSFGLASDTCVNQGFPSVFTRVSSYKNFVQTWTAGT